MQSIGELRLPSLKLYNPYGPAETITCPETAEDNDSNDDGRGSEGTVIPAGYPLPGYSIYIVDHSLDVLPQGAAGEIVIGGPSVSTEYLNDGKLREEKFIGNAYDSPSGRRKDRQPRKLDPHCLPDRRRGPATKGW